MIGRGIILNKSPIPTHALCLCQGSISSQCLCQGSSLSLCLCQGSMLSLCLCQGSRSVEGHQKEDYH